MELTPSRVGPRGERPREQPEIERWSRAPCTSLAPFIDRFWGWQSASPAQLPVLLPGTGSECLFHYRQPLLQPDGRPLPSAHLICPREQTTQLLSQGPLAFIAVRFKSGQLRHFTARPFIELHDEFADIEILWPGEATALNEQLALATHQQARQQLLEQFLYRQLVRHHQGGEQAQDALIERLYYAPNQRIDTLACDWGWSTRHLERRFKQAFALTPKRFARLARLHHTLRQLALQPRREPLAIILERGFSDQSHFIHETRDLTGLAPGQLQSLMRLGTHYYHAPSRQPE